MENTISNGDDISIKYERSSSSLINIRYQLKDKAGNLADNFEIGTREGDTLEGGNGKDTLIGNAGDDTLTGNGGVDTFDYNATTDGNDTITNFMIGQW